MARIVLIDDDPILAALVKQALAPSAHDLVWLDDGDDALAEIWDHNADLIVLDCGLPGKPGMIVLRDIRKTLGFERLPVLILTSRSSQAYEALALGEGASDYLRKPFDPTDLLARVNRLVEPG
ncbi:MAG: response regulator transcription factor [Myxococcota bacterium]|jgi:DNA-binding response OmpR family regulator